MGPGDVMALFLSIVGLFGTPICIVAMRQKHRERMAELQARQSAPIEAGEIARLSEEIARLRDTTTQYDMSVEHALQEIRHRLSAVEQRGAAHRSSPVVIEDGAGNIISVGVGSQPNSELRGRGSD